MKRRISSSARTVPDLKKIDWPGIILIVLAYCAGFMTHYLSVLIPECGAMFDVKTIAFEEYQVMSLGLESDHFIRGRVNSDH